MRLKQVLQMPIDEQIDIAVDEKTSKAVLVGLIQSKDYRVRACAASNLNLGLDVILELDCLDPENDHATFFEIVHRDDMTTETAKKFYDWAIRNASGDMLECLANSHAAPADMLRKIAESTDTYFLMGVGHNGNTPPDLLDSLSDSDSHYVRNAVAENTSAPTVLLEYLSFDRSAYVRSQLTTNKSSPMHMLRLMAVGEQHHDVLESLAERFLDSSNVSGGENDGRDNDV